MQYEEVEVNNERWFDLTPLLNEEFRNIKGYEGLYQVSNYGRIKSNAKKKGWCNKNQTILKNSDDKDGYKRVTLLKNGKYYYYKVHRLVAQTFIPNPNNLSQVNHKNEIKDDNRVDNLEWCECPYNNNYGSRNERIAKKLGKPVIQYDLNMKKIIEYQSTQDAGRKTGLDASHIGECCRKLKYHKTYGGYIWKYKGDE